MGTLGSAHVGRGDRQILHLQILHIGNENAARIQMIDRNVEKPLNLIGVQIHRHDPVDARRSQQIGHQLGSYRDAGPVLTVLTGPSEIGHDGNHPVSRRTVGRINHQQQLHQIVRRRESRLYDKDGAPANTFVVGRLKLSVTELQDL